MHQVTLKVQGMTCGHCVRAIKTRLEELRGVLKADVQLKGATAVVDFDPLTVSVEEMVAALADEGYTAERSRGLG